MRRLTIAGLPAHYRLYDLRHTSVSALLADGVPLAEVAQLAGHAHPGITASLYADVVPRVRQPSTGRLARFYADRAAELGACRTGALEETSGSRGTERITQAN